MKFHYILDFTVSASKSRKPHFEIFLTASMLYNMLIASS